LEVPVAVALDHVVHTVEREDEAQGVWRMRICEGIDRVKIGAGDDDELRPRLRGLMGVAPIAKGRTS
jgi:hypothetical protein